MNTQHIAYPTPIGVFGLGLSGASAARFLARMRVPLIISDTKENPALEAELAALSPSVRSAWGTAPELLCQARTILKSPGISLDQPVLVRAREMGIPIITDIELAAPFLRDARVIAVTGTNGKSTVSALAAHICRQLWPQTVLCGNIGSPVCDHLPLVDPNGPVVIEVSSYQLECIATFHARIGVVTNITPDHLEHHKTMARYKNAKEMIGINQTPCDYVVLNGDDPELKSFIPRGSGSIFYFSRHPHSHAGMVDDNGTFVYQNGPTQARFVPELKIPGAHNRANALAACASCLLAGVDVDAVHRGVRTFPGLPHRLETVGVRAGVTFINDSKATNVESTLIALAALSGPLHLILGGRDKGFPYTPLISPIKERVAQVYLIGEASEKIERDLSGACVLQRCETLPRAVAAAAANATPGETVLLSPACASFDQFKNFEDRGDQFRMIVQALGVSQ